MVLANTEELHEKIERLCSRVRELEDALRTLQSTVSERTHPLLQEDLLNLKTPSNVAGTGTAQSVGEGRGAGVGVRGEAPSATNGLTPRLDRVGDEDGFIDAFGMLSPPCDTLGSFWQSLTCFTICRHFDYWVRGRD